MANSMRSDVRIYEYLLYSLGDMERRMTPSELVAKLRDLPKWTVDLRLARLRQQAADEIERLNAELESTRNAGISIMEKFRSEIEAAEKELAKKSEWLDCANQLLKNAEKRAAKLDKLPQIIDQLERCNFECIAGPLRLNVAFIELKALAEDGK